MGCAIGQVKVEHLWAFADQDALPRKSNAGRCRRADVGDEHALPDGGALRRLYILNVKHEFREAFIEDSGLHFKRRLRCFQPVLEPAQGGLRSRRQVHGIEQSKRPRGDGKKGNDPQERPRPDAAGSHGGDFAVGRKAAQAD